VNASNTRDGEEYLRRAIELEPNNARFYYHLGALYLRINKPSAAEIAFRKAVELKPDYVVPHYQIGRILSDAGHAEDAAREFESALHYDP
jgi:protein O-GlcNAc transferase